VIGVKMMKKLIIINGTMGVGKTATCKTLYEKLQKSVWLDGDWCWMMNPFVVNEENKEMVLDNITYLLRNFLMNSSFEYVIFNWVIHLEEIFDTILSKLDGLEFEVVKITLMCDEDNFRKRVLADIENDLKEKQALERGLERIPLYQNMNTIKVDTSNISVLETINKIIEIVEE
jgi:cytidylate kinase